jgi:RNA polymerase sigma-70 factor (sigma-E family)
MDQDADFADYARARWPALVRAAVFLGCDPHEAEDLAQATLVRCLQRWERVRAADERDAYVYRILVNTRHDQHRRRRVVEHPVERLPDRGVADRTRDVDLADAVHRALSGLTEEQRQVVVLRHLAQLGEAQTAAALGIAVGTVKSRLSRALRQLATDPALQDLKGMLSRD